MFDNGLSEKPQTHQSWPYTVNLSMSVDAKKTHKRTHTLNHTKLHTLRRQETEEERRKQREGEKKREGDLQRIQP